MLKSYGVVGWVVAHVILVSALGPNPSIFLYWGTFIQLRGLLRQGPGLGLGPGLDNNKYIDNLLIINSTFPRSELCSSGQSPRFPRYCLNKSFRRCFSASSSISIWKLLAECHLWGPWGPRVDTMNWLKENICKVKQLENDKTNQNRLKYKWLRKWTQQLYSRIYFCKNLNRSFQQWELT